MSERVYMNLVRVPVICKKCTKIFAHHTVTFEVEERVAVEIELTLYGYCKACAEPLEIFYQHKTLQSVTN